MEGATRQDMSVGACASYGKQQLAAEGDVWTVFIYMQGGGCYSFLR